MAQKIRKIRAFFYGKTVLFGVRLTDWKWIGGATLLVFFLSVFFKIQFRGFIFALPLAVFTCLAGMSFFNLVRVKRKPLWLEHKTSHLWRTYIKKTTHLRPLRSGELARCNYWLIDSQDGNELI